VRIESKKTNMKHLAIASALFCILFLLPNCTSQNQPGAASVQNVDVAKFKELIAGGNTIILDVRTPEETAGGTIDQASTIDFYDPDFKKKISVMDHSKNILVYCKAGGRSAQAAEILVQNGFTHVYNLEGGISAWQANGNPVTAGTVAKDEHIQEMSAKQFDKLLTQNKLVLVDFHTVWCSPCRKMAPIIDKMEQEFKGKAAVLRIDVDKSTELAAKYQIQAVPVFILFKDGKEVWKQNGAMEEEALKKQLLESLN
jgi:thioredoxin